MGQLGKVPDKVRDKDKYGPSHWDRLYICPARLYFVGLGGFVPQPGQARLQRQSPGARHRVQTEESLDLGPVELVPSHATTAR